MVVVDDVGAGHSHLDRVAAIHPDLLKADRSLVHGCAANRVQRAVLRALVGLSEDIAGWVVAEGVHPPGPGDDHAHKEYVYLLDADAAAVYESPPDVPLPNARVCVTVSTPFVDAEGTPRLLCVHLDAELQRPMGAGPPMDALGR